MRAVVGVQRVAVRRGHGARRAGRRPAAARPGRLRHPGRERVRRPHRRREPPLLRPGARGRPRRASTAAIAAVDLADHRDHVGRATSPAASAAGPAWPSRCSATPTCWCSTSRPSASTRCCAGDLWRLFHRLADSGSAVLVSSHVMDEADRCDRLLLHARGPASSPTARPPRSAADRRRDVEAAFLQIVEGRGMSTAAGDRCAGRRRRGPHASCAATTARWRC